MSILDKYPNRPADTREAIRWARKNVIAKDRWAFHRAISDPVNNKAAVKKRKPKPKAEPKAED